LVSKIITFSRATESIVNYGWESWTLDYKLMKIYKYNKMDFWRTAKTYIVLKVRNDVIRNRSV